MMFQISTPVAADTARHAIMTQLFTMLYSGPAKNCSLTHYHTITPSHYHTIKLTFIHLYIYTHI